MSILTLRASKVSAKLVACSANGAGSFVFGDTSEPGATTGMREMSLTIECAECDYEGKVSPAKAGKTISCPSCSELIEVPAGKPSRRASKSRPDRRPKTDNSSIPLIALGGATVLLVGILAMYMIKKAQMVEDFGADVVNGTSPVDSTPGTAIPVADTPVADKPSSSADKPAIEQTATGNNVATTVDTPKPKETPENFILPEINAVDPGMLLLADMNEVVLDVTGLPEDTRGAVQNAVNANIKSALAKCRLDCSEDETKPRIIVDLDLRKIGGLQKLGMTAELQGQMSGVPVTVWEHEAALVPIDKKALNGSIALPGLDREVAAFFNSLRDRITTARTTINSIKENQRRRKEARQLEETSAVEG